MPKTVSLEKYHFIRNEVTRWEEENLLATGQGDLILSRYAPPDWQQKSIVACSVLGTVLLGWTVVMYIAANVQVIPVTVKLLFVLGFMIASFWTAWQMNSRQTGKSLFVDSLIVLGCLCYGAEIWLLAQAFQCDLDYPVGPLIWGIGVLAVAFATRSSLASVMAVLLLQWYLLWAQPGLLEACGVLAASLYCGYLTRNTWTIAFALTGQTFWINCKETQTPVSLLPILILWGISLWGWWVWHRNKADLCILGKPYLYIGVLCTCIGLSSLPWARPDYVGMSRIAWTADGIIHLQLAAINAAFVLIFTVMTEKKSRFEFLAAGLAYLGTIALTVFPDPATSGANALADGALVTTILSALAIYAIALDDIQLVVLTLICGTVEGFNFYNYTAGHDRLLFFLLCALVFLVSAFVFDRRCRRARWQKEMLLKLDPIGDPNEMR